MVQSLTDVISQAMCPYEELMLSLRNKLHAQKTVLLRELNSEVRRE